MADLVAQTEFARLLRSLTETVSDSCLRRLLYKYCTRYQDLYWFEELDDPLAFVGMTLTEDRNELQTLLPSVMADVEHAMCEYCESLNEIGTAVNRLLDETPLTPDDVIIVVSHVWNAYACNEDESEFVPREDGFLCKLLLAESNVT